MKGYSACRLHANDFLALPIYVENFKSLSVANSDFALIYPLVNVFISNQQKKVFRQIVKSATFFKISKTSAKCNTLSGYLHIYYKALCTT